MDDPLNISDLNIPLKCVAQSLCAGRWLTTCLLRGVLVAVDVSLEVLTEGGELLVCVL